MSAVERIVLTVPAPGAWLTGNAATNRHWRHRATLVKTWRETAAWRARQARLDPIPSPFAVTATIHKRDRRLFDLDGVVPTIKACVDGLRDAGVIEADDFRHMVRLVVVAGEPDRELPRLVLRVEEVGEQGRRDIEAEAELVRIFNAEVAHTPEELP